MTGSQNLTPLLNENALISAGDCDCDLRNNDYPPFLRTLNWVSNSPLVISYSIKAIPLVHVNNSMAAGVIRTASEKKI